MKVEDKKESKSKKAIIIATILALIIGFLVFTGISNNFNIITRRAVMGDIDMNTSQDISLNMKYKMIPKTDINDLEITFYYYSGSNKLLSTKIKKIGDVIKGTEYTVEISLTEFSLSNIFNIEYVKTVVSEGTIIYF